VSLSFASNSLVEGRQGQGLCSMDLESSYYDMSAVFEMVHERDWEGLEPMVSSGALKGFK